VTSSIPDNSKIPPKDEEISLSQQILAVKPSPQDETIRSPSLISAN